MKTVWSKLTPWSVGLLTGVAVSLVCVGPVEAGDLVDNRSHYKESREVDNSFNAPIHNNVGGQSNSQSLAVEGGKVEAAGGTATVETVTNYPRQVPALGLTVSGDCAGLSAGLARNTFSLLLGTVNKDCMRIHGAAAFDALGDRDMAYKLLMDMDVVKALTPKPELNAHGWPARESDL